MLSVEKRITEERPRRTGRGRHLLRGVGLAAISAVTLAACASGTASGESSDQYSLTYSSSLSPESQQNKLIDKWTEEVIANTGGAVEIDTTYSGALLDPTDALAGVANKRADMAMSSPQYTPGELPISSFTELPFVAENTEAFIHSVRDAYETDEAFRQEWHDQGVEVLLFVPAGTNSLVTKNPVETVDDLQGLQLRAVGETAAMFEEAGANTNAIPIPELYESLERGLVDGTSTLSVEIADDVGVVETASNIYELGLGEYTIIPVFVNKEWWDGLPEEIQGAFRDAADNYYDTFADDLTTMQEETCSSLTDLNAKFGIWDEGNRSALFELGGESRWNEWIENHTTDEFDAKQFFEEHRQRIAEYSEDSTYVSTAEQCSQS